MRAIGMFMHYLCTREIREISRRTEKCGAECIAVSGFFCNFVETIAFSLEMKNLAIFASGSGTNAENIARLFHQGNQVRVAVVLCNRKSAGVYERMERLGVPCLYIPSSVWDNDPEQIVETLRPYHIDLVVLAGFMRTVQPAIIDAYRGRIVNIHPSLLPAYGGKGMYGHHVHEAVIAAGEKKSGVTVHYVTDEIDGGDIVMQQSVEITPDDTPETLEAKIHPVEYALYPRAIVAALSRTQGPSAPVPAPAGEAPKSVDTAWAERLRLKYDEKEAAERRAQVEERARQASAGQPPVPPGGTLPPVPAASTQAGESLSRDLPKSHMTAAVLATILCCTIPGIVAIVYAGSVNSRLAAGDVEGARRASSKAEGWVIASFVLGLLSATLWLPITIISSMI